MSVSDSRRRLFALLTASQVDAVKELVAAYEAEQTEEAITSSEPSNARQRVLAARDIRALLKVPKGEAGQA